MGVLGILVVGDEGDAEKIALSAASSPHAAEVAGLTTINLENLEKLVTDGEEAEAQGLGDPEFMDEETWVFSFPKDFAATLGALSDAQQNELATRWAKLEDFAHDRWDESRARATLQTICREAQRATSAGRQLFLWMSL